jgi:hypothetical protein
MLRMIEATPDHLFALQASAKVTHGLPAYHWSCQMAQILNGTAFTLVEDGSDEVLAMGGVYRFPGRPADAWFLHGERTAARMLGFARLAAGVVAAVARQEQYGVVCMVKPDNLAGERLARIIGFRTEGEMYGSHRVWHWEGMK